MKRLLLVLLLGGCAAVQPLVNPVDAILGEAVSAARAPAAEQAAALARAEKEAKRPDAAATDRLRLATLLATLPAPLRDDPRAAKLLEPIADVSQPGVGRFAALLAAQIAERQRLAGEVERVAREAAHATRERAALDKERAALDKEREKETQALRQQIDALRAIERGILERDEKLRRRQK
jgi:hypothetical protein